MQLRKNIMDFYTVNFCCGIGGQDLGLEESKHEYKGIQGRFKTIVGIDNDPVACKNFERITGSRAVCADLFDKELYTMFHGKEPGEEWDELTPEKVREHCNGIYPDMVFMSPPCKGFSRLLPKKTSQLPKYQALNRLPERILDLSLEAWFDDLPAIFLMENVPGIRDKGRGSETLKRIKAKLAARGYIFHEDLYDCGEWGGLGQRRVRYLFIARLPDKVPSFIFRPPKLPLKTIGNILGPLPMPGDIEKCGRLHRIPKLAWRTWERLALIPSGKDWRALENFNREQWKGAWKIVPWDEPSNAVTAATKGVGSSTGVSAVADPRLKGRKGRYPGTYRVMKWDEPSNTLTCHTDIQTGAISVVEPRISKKWSGAGNYGVMKWNEPSKTITASGDIHAGSAAVADPRIPGPDERGVFIIIAADGTWHRPITTYEGAMLQGFPRTLKDGSPFDLIDCNDGKAREYIGNAVPVQTATAIGNALLETMIANYMGEWHWGFSDDLLWVSGNREWDKILLRNFHGQ